MNEPNKLGKSVSCKSQPASIQEIDFKLLRFQNTSLVTRLDFLKKELKNLRNSHETLELRLKNAETFIGCFASMWTNLFHELEFIHFLFKTPNEDKLAGKFLQCLTFIDEVVKIGEGINENQGDVAKQTRNKVEAFMKNISNIYSEVYIEFQVSQEKIVKTLTDLVKMDVNEIARGFFHDNIGLKSKVIELESGFSQNKNKLKEINIELARLTEEKLTKEKLNEIIQENEDLKNTAESLSRRIRFLSDYAGNGIDMNMANEDEKFDCVCGALINYQLPLSTPPPPQIHLQNSNSSPNETNRIEVTPNGMEIEKKEEEINRVGSEMLVRQNDELVREKVELKKKIEKMRIEKNNMEEIIFNSELFKNLVAQSQDLLKYTNNLKGKLNLANKKIVEIEKARAEELEEIFIRFNEEKHKLKHELEKAQNGIQGKMKDENSDLINISEFTGPFIKTVDEANELNVSLKNENVHLRNSLGEYRAKYLEEHERIITLNEKIEQLTLELTTIKLQISGHISYEKFDLKHLTFKEFIIQMNEIVMKNCPHLKKRFDEINGYIKTRETKIEYIENKLKASNNEIKHRQKQIDDLIKEVDITAKIYGDLLVTNKRLLDQIKESDEIKAKIITEKAIEKKNFEQEKTTLQIKLNADKESMKNLNVLITELQNNKKTLEALKTTLELELTNVKNYNNELKSINQETSIKFANLSQEVELLKKDREELTKTLHNYIKELEQKKNETALKAQDPEVVDRLLILEHKKYKAMAICSVCHKRDKNVILKMCNHTFCKECIEKNLQIRSRMCPICRMKFGSEDVREIFWN